MQHDRVGATPGEHSHKKRLYFGMDLLATRRYFFVAVLFDWKYTLTSVDSQLYPICNPFGVHVHERARTLPREKYAEWARIVTESLGQLCFLPTAIRALHASVKYLPPVCATMCGAACGPKDGFPRRFCCQHFFLVYFLGSVEAGGVRVGISVLL